ncbi:hypothetical protein B0O99DRAFT_748948 [Bisporella sp. PMI_857]|nr:hypothetical protein B0O99DRAFT_748948 [Bisporella sp. PMI_857]
MSLEESLVDFCRKSGNALSSGSCKVEFNASSGNFTRIGVIQEGEFEGDPDIAGAGIFLAFTVLSIFVMATGVILGVIRIFSFIYLCCSPRNDSKWLRSMEWSNVIHLWIDSLILASADTQILLVLAIGQAFYATERCTLSLYHYLVLYHMVLMGIWTSMLAFTLSRSPFKSPLASLCRVGALFMCAISFGQEQTIPASNPEIQQLLRKIPGTHQRDSVIILPVSCILDESTNFLVSLKDEDKVNLMGNGPGRFFEAPGEQATWIVAAAGAITGGFVFIGFMKGFQRGYYKQKPTHTSAKQNTRARLNYWLNSFVKKGLFWTLCTAYIIYNWIIISKLREWVDRSIWLQREDNKNPESSFQGIGQVAPLASLGAAVFAVCDGGWEAIKHRQFLTRFSSDYDNNARHERHHIERGGHQSHGSDNEALHNSYELQNIS